MIRINKETDPEVIKWIEQVCNDLDNDPNIMPIDDVRKKLRAMGADVEGFHERIAKTLGVPKLRSEHDIPSDWKTRLISSIKDFFIIPKPYAICMTTIMCLIFLFLVHKILTYDPLENLISKSYDMVLTDKAFFKNSNLNRVLRIPGDDDRTLGFGSPKQDDPAYLALRAGMLSAREKLSEPDGAKKEDWSSEFVRYFHTGQWAFLMRAVCLSDVDIPKEFWQQQRIIITELSEGFPENDKINAEFGKIKSILEESEVPNKIRQQRLAYQIESLIEFLSP